jgi:hypothetical protein
MSRNLRICGESYRWLESFFYYIDYKLLNGGGYSPWRTILRDPKFPLTGKFTGNFSEFLAIDHSHPPLSHRVSCKSAEMEQGIKSAYQGIKFPVMHVLQVPYAFSVLPIESDPTKCVNLRPVNRLGVDLMV